MKLKYKIEFKLILFFIKFFSIFPDKIRFKFAENIGKLFFYLDKKRRDISIANISLAFPDMSLKKKKEIAYNSYKILAKSFISTIWFDEYLSKDENCNFVNLDPAIKRAHESSGLIAACMHMGNMEASLKIAKKYPMVTIAKKQKNPLLDKYITDNREKMGVKLLKKSRTTAAELKNYLGKNYLFGIFSDHRANGTEVLFFGHKTDAPTGAVSLAMRNNLPLFIVYNILNPDNTSTSFVSDEIKLIDTGNFKKDVHDNVQNLIYEMEKIILKYPEQWMWFHDRWKFAERFKNEN